VLTQMTVHCVEPLRYYHVCHSRQTNIEILCNKLKQEVKSRESALGKEVKRHNSMDRVLISDSNNRSRLVLSFKIL